MRKQIAAANWKMNCTFQEGEKLLDDILGAEIELANHQLAIFAVPYPYLLMRNRIIMLHHRIAIIKNLELTPEKFLLRCFIQ